uniref:O-fucosyltransferase family protein n=1 Tax=Quercus lobata TaxID=97700 RepID=A0A7N2M8P3_QUELO
MVAYSQCEYSGLSPSSVKAIEAARGDRKPWTGELAQVWRKRGKYPLIPNETAFILQSLSIPTDTNIYLAAGDAMRVFKGLYKTLFLSRRAFAEFTSQDFSGRDMMQAPWKAHLEDYVMARGSALPDCFCEFKL